MEDADIKIMVVCPHNKIVSAVVDRTRDNLAAIKQLGFDAVPAHAGVAWEKFGKRINLDNAPL